jgi:hypothetical protein
MDGRNILLKILIVLQKFTIQTMCSFLFTVKLNVLIHSKRSDDNIFGSCFLPKAIQLAEQHAAESLLPGFSWRPK